MAVLETFEAVVAAVAEETRRLGVRWTRGAETIRCSTDDALRLLRTAGYHDVDAGDVEDCSSPLTFLVLARTGRLRDWRKAIDVLGVPEEVARRVMATADGEPGDAVELGMGDKPQVVLAADRASLLRALEETPL